MEMVFVVHSENPVLRLLCFLPIHVFVCSLLSPLLPLLLFCSATFCCFRAESGTFPGEAGSSCVGAVSWTSTSLRGQHPLLPEMLSCHFRGTRLRRRAVRLTGILERAFPSCFTSCHQRGKKSKPTYLAASEISSFYMN